MAEKRLIDANALRKRIEEWMQELNLEFTVECAYMGYTLDDVLDYIDTAPTVQHECSCQSWHPASEIPPLHHVTDDDDSEDVLEYEASDPLLLYTANGRTVSGARYVKSDLFVGWDDWSGGLFNTEVTHWMPQPRPPKGQKHG